MFDFKSLINSLINRNEPRSATALSATQLVQDLPETEYFQAQIEIVKAVAIMNEDKEITLKERLLTLLYVDGRSHLIQHQLTQEFISDPIQNRAYLPVILAYEYEFSIACKLTLRQYREKPLEHLSKEANLLALRGLSHHASQLIWNTFRYIESDGELWHECYYFYSYFEKQELQKEPLQIFPDDVDTHNAERLLLKICLLELANPSSLPLKELTALNFLLDTLTKYTALSGTSVELSNPIFAIELGSFSSPMVMMHSTIGERFRYFSLANFPAALQKIKDIINSGNTQKLSPSVDLGLSTDQWTELTAHLEMHWLNKDKAMRHRTEKLIDAYEVSAAVGYNQISFYTKVSLNQSSSKAERPWKVYGKGESSLILSYSGQKDRNIVLGNLIMVEPDDDVSVIGIISRFVRQKQGSAQIDIRIIGKSPVGVTLRNPDHPEEIPVNAIYITQDNSTNGNRWFLLPLDYIREHHKAVLTPSGEVIRNTFKRPLYRNV